LDLRAQSIKDILVTMTTLLLEQSVLNSQLLNKTTSSPTRSFPAP
jgi:hypothetical protein